MLAFLFTAILAKEEILCQDELIQYIKGFASFYPSNKYEEMAYFSGRRINQLGDYMLCHQLEKAHYLLITSKKMHNLQLGLCVPISCNESDIEHFLNSNDDANLLLSSFQDEFSLNFPDTHRSFTFLTVMMIIAMITVTKFVQTGSYFDYKYSKTDEQQEAELIDLQSESNQHDQTQLSKFKRFAMCFSAFSNLKRIFAVRQEQQDLDMFNGVRVMSIGWVILGNMISGIVTQTVNYNFTWPQEYSKHLKVGIIYGGFFAVDTFFWLSGFLQCYFILKLLQEHQNISWIQIILHRMVRIIPAYWFMMFFFINLIPRTFIYPADDNAIYVDCSEYWWTNLLFINNFIPNFQGNACVRWAWFLPNDIQLFLVGLVVIYVYQKYSNRIGLWLIASQIFISFLTCAILTAAYDIQLLDIEVNFYKIYNKPYCRAAPYAFGTLCGIIYLQHDQLDWAYRVKSLLTGKYTKWVSFLTGFVLINFLIFVQQPEYEAVLNNENEKLWSVGETALFKGIMYPLYGFALSALLMPLLLGQFNYLRRFLGQSLWSPFAKLSYCVYLMHPVIMYVVIINLGHSQMVNDLSILSTWIAMVTLSYVAALWLSLYMEQPFIQLEKLILHRNQIQQKMKNLSSDLSEERIDQIDDPTDQQVLEYAAFLGFDLPNDQNLLYIAKEGLQQPLPEGWKAIKQQDGSIYFWHSETGKFQYEHPCDIISIWRYTQALQGQIRNFDSYEENSDEEESESEDTLDQYEENLLQEVQAELREYRDQLQKQFEAEQINLNKHNAKILQDYQENLKQQLKEKVARQQQRVNNKSQEQLKALKATKDQLQKELEEMSFMHLENKKEFKSRMNDEIQQLQDQQEQQQKRKIQLYDEQLQKDIQEFEINAKDWYEEQYNVEANKSDLDMQRITQSLNQRIEQNDLLIQTLSNQIIDLRQKNTQFISSEKLQQVEKQINELKRIVLQKGIQLPQGNIAFTKFITKNVPFLTLEQEESILKKWRRKHL